ncbi:MAG: hypothetical protein V1773_19795 [bacterium]
MKNIVLLILVILLIKLSFLFTPPNNGLWSNLNTIGVISGFFLLYLLFHLQKEEIPKGTKIFISGILVFLMIFTTITWKSYFNLTTLQKEQLVKFETDHSNSVLKETVYEKYFKILQAYNSSPTSSKNSLKKTFDSFNLRDSLNTNKLMTYFSDKNLEIRISDVDENEIVLICLNKNHIGRLERFVNFGGGIGYIQFRAILNLGGIKYESEN